MSERTRLACSLSRVGVVMLGLASLAARTVAPEPPIITSLNADRLEPRFVVERPLTAVEPLGAGNGFLAVARGALCRYGASGDVPRWCRRERSPSVAITSDDATILVLTPSAEIDALVAHVVAVDTGTDRTSFTMAVPEGGRTIQAVGLDPTAATVTVLLREGDTGSSVEQWDVRTQRSTGRRRLPMRESTLAVLSRDTRVVALATDEFLETFDTRTGRSGVRIPAPSFTPPAHVPRRVYTRILTSGEPFEVWNVAEQRLRVRIAGRDVTEFDIEQNEQVWIAADDDGRSLVWGPYASEPDHPVVAWRWSVSDAAPHRIGPALRVAGAEDEWRWLGGRGASFGFVDGLRRTMSILQSDGARESVRQVAWPPPDSPPAWEFEQGAAVPAAGLPSGLRALLRERDPTETLLASGWPVPAGTPFSGSGGGILEHFPRLRIRRPNASVDDLGVQTWTPPVISPDGTRAIVNSRDHGALLVDLSQHGPAALRAFGPADAPLGLRHVWLDATTVASIGGARGLSIVDVGSNNVLATFAEGVSGGGVGLCGPHTVCMTVVDQVVRWDWITGAPRALAELPGRFQNAQMEVRDGHLIVAAERGLATLDLETGQIDHDAPTLTLEPFRRLPAPDAPAHERLIGYEESSQTAGTVDPAAVAFICELNLTRAGTLQGVAHPYRGPLAWVAMSEGAVLIDPITCRGVWTHVAGFASLRGRLSLDQRYWVVDLDAGLTVFTVPAGGATP